MTQAFRGVRFFLVAGLLLAATVFLQARRQKETIVPHRPLASFPMEIDDWRGREIPISKEVRDVLGDGDFMERAFFRQGDIVSLFVAYFPSQRKGNTMHSPKNCLPGAGWTPLESTQVTLPISGKQVESNRYVIAKGQDRQLVMYWYQSHDRAVASEYWAKFYLVADAMRTNRSDGALVRLLTPMRPGESIESAQARIVAFAQPMVPLLSEYIPQ